MVSPVNIDGGMVTMSWHEIFGSNRSGSVFIWSVSIHGGNKLVIKEVSKFIHSQIEAVDTLKNNKFNKNIHFFSP